VIDAGQLDGFRIVTPTPLGNAGDAGCRIEHGISFRFTSADCAPAVERPSSHSEASMMRGNSARLLRKNHCSFGSSSPFFDSIDLLLTWTKGIEYREIDESDSAGDSQLKPSFFR
jgi:hypothetical protein